MSDQTARMMRVGFHRSRHFSIVGVIKNSIIISFVIEDDEHYSLARIARFRQIVRVLAESEQQSSQICSTLSASEYFTYQSPSDSR